MLILGGLRFNPTAQGGMCIEVGHNATENADVIRTIVFTPEQWQCLVAMTIEQPASVVEEPKEPDFTPGTISTVPSDIALDLISKATTIERLDLLEQDELANQKNEGGRKGVLAAIAKRREELSK